MKPNPGGTITGEAILNREKEIESIWRALQNQSVVVISERRVGKTSILRKMEENSKDGWDPILYLVEGKEHPVEFVEGLYETLLEKKLLKNKFHKLKKFYTKYVGGEQIGSWKLPQIKKNWKPLLDSIMQDIIESGKRVLLMFDELPLMLAKFIKSGEIGPLGTMGFLDTLRELRNKYEASKNVSFIFCGSIGIHLVIKDLKRNHGYNSDPVNNMKIISISSMDEDGAKKLCQKNDYWNEDDIINIVKSHMEIDSESVKETLDLIWSDHYLVRNIKNNQRTYKFRYAILKKWWKVNRG